MNMYKYLKTVVLVLVLLSVSTGLAIGQGPEPNDPLYEEQWALERINASCAWQQTTGSQQVTVAVVDTGVDLGHPDLVGRLRDDGYDFAEDDPDPSDEQGHGTHVSGIIAATANNAEGIAGLAPNVTILPVRVLGDEGGGSDQMIADGIRYAIEKDVQVINLSLGAAFFVINVMPESNAAIVEASDAGILVVVAAGNDYLPFMNAVNIESLEAMVVAASNEQEERAEFSNFGPWVSVTAPGEDILSTMPTYPVQMTSEDIPAKYRSSQDYDTLSGTSMAAPYVSALAALVFSVHPDWTPNQVRDAIEDHANRDIYEDETYLEILMALGAGRIDACGTLSE